jgi:uncharacterized surface protein with fasciclin (FAS1) repeats
MIIISISACTDVWKDHIKVSEQISPNSLMEQIESNSQLSIFAGYLKQTGYDQILSGQNNCTVWAPTNDAFSSIDASLLSDSVQLRLIIGNHICFQLQTAQNIDTTFRLTSLNGKLVSWAPGTATFEGNVAVSTNNICNNGVLHVTNKVALPKKNLWEILSSTQVSSIAPVCSNFLVRYSYLYFDEASSPIKYVDPNSGKNVYDSVKYVVYRYLQDVADVRNEKKDFTCFILTDAALTQQATIYSKYFTESIAANTDSVTWLNILKDYVFGYKITSIPDTIISESGTKIGIDKSSIIDTIEASNGIIYVLNSSQISLLNKVRQFKLEGESSGRSLFNSTKFDQYTNYREISTTLASNYKYIWINNHNFADNYFSYTVTLHSCKYKVYWVAPHINPAAGLNLNQQLSITVNGIETTLGTKAQTNGFTEVNFTDYTSPLYGNAIVKVKTAAGVANQLSLDYVRFAPVLP